MIYSIGIPITSNEKNTIRETMSSLEEDLRYHPCRHPVETLICLNNCDSETEKIVRGIKSKLTNPRMIYSSPGLIPAQNKLIEMSDKSRDFILFYNGDVRINLGSTSKMMNFLEDHPEVYAASGDQLAQKLDSFLYQVYNIIGLKPQIMTSRKYLTGKIFAIRKNSYYVPDFLVSDDTFLSHYLVFKYGPNAVQTVPGASITYRGPKTIADYYQKKRRLYLEKSKMFEHNPELCEISNYLKKSRIPEEVSKLSPKERFQLYIHDMLKASISSIIKCDSGGPVWIPLESTKEL